MALGIDFEVEGIHGVVTGLNIVADTIPRGGNAHVKTRMQEAINVTKTYPPMLVGQRYVRTGVYGKSFSMVGNPFHGGMTLKTDAVDFRGKSFSHFVAGGATGKGQYGLHIGRWKVFYEEVVRRLDTLYKDLDRMIQDAAHRVGL